MKKVIIILFFISILVATVVFESPTKSKIKKQDDRERIASIRGGCLSPDKKYFSFLVKLTGNGFSGVESPYIYSLEKSQVIKSGLTQNMNSTSCLTTIWSSDSMAMAYLLYDRDYQIQQLCIYDMSSPMPQERIIITDRANVFGDFGPVTLSEPIYFESSKIILFINATDAKHRGIYSINKDGGNVQQINSMPEIFFTFPFQHSFISKGKNIYCYVSPRHTCKIYNINIEDGKYRELSKYTDQLPRISEVSYESESNRLLVARTEPNKAFILNPDESDKEENVIVLSDRSISSAVWLNKEELICGDIKGSYKLNIITKKCEFLTYGESINYVGFIADTKKVIGISKDTASEKYSAWLMDTDGKNRRIIFPTPSTDNKTFNEPAKEKPVDGK
jgi:hypothetical protein